MTKHSTIYAWLKENISNGTFKTGERITSENQLCRQFNISRQTARQAISSLEQEGLVTKKRGSGTYVNDAPTAPRSKKVAILTTYTYDYILANIIAGMQTIINKYQYSMVLRSSSNKVQLERNHLVELLSSDIDGLIVEGAKTAIHSPNIELYKRFKDKNIPIVFINGYFENFDCNYVINDDVLGGRLCTRHLIENGHTKIGAIFKHDDIQGKMRYKGYIDELLAHGREINEEKIMWYSTESLEYIFKYPNLLMNIFDDCTAIMCYNDQISLKLLQLYRDIGFNKSIISFDNTSLCDISYIPLTSLSHPGSYLGKLATESLIKMMQNPNYEVKHIFEPYLVERSSVKKIYAAD